mgnify:FL=1
MKFYRLLMIAGLVLLVILGLNTSSNGINNLTQEARGAVFDLDYKDSGITVEAMGKNYHYSLDKFKASVLMFKNLGEDFITEIKEYINI